tara:strand:+ start:9 stop:398 length:390 start_codon:yes stop_codon:yes gene_type:complete
MANPNIVGVTEIKGNFSSVTANTGSGVQSVMMVENLASSGEIYKINTILATNKNTDTANEVTVCHYAAEKMGGARNEIAHRITVPAQSTLIVMDKSTSIYLKENQSLGCNAQGNASIVVHTSWEEISAS